MLDGESSSVFVSLGSRYTGRVSLERPVLVLMTSFHDALHNLRIPLDRIRESRC